MTAIDNAKFKVRQELQALQRRLSLLEEFERQGYRTHICEEPYHNWHDIEWLDGWTGLRYDDNSGEIVKNLQICILCGTMRTTTFKLSDTVIEDPFDELRERTTKPLHCVRRLSIHMAGV
jgi:hypothetical protein